jgi:peptide/nickel transport system substrate-binding protein
VQHHRSNRARRRAGVVGVLVAFGLVAGACGGDDGESSTTTPSESTSPSDSTSPDGSTPDTTPEPAGEAKYGGKLVIGIEADTSSPWRPSEMVCAISCHQVVRAVYDTLMLPGEGDIPYPMLAEKVEGNDDYTEWRLTARSGITFHDGTPFDGAAIADNLNRHRSALLTGVVLRSVTDVSVDPSDPQTAVVSMSAPWAAFPYALTGQIGYMASPAWLAASDADEALRSKPVGTGPFVFVDYRPNEFFRATRNENYWLDPYPYLDEIEFRPIADALARRDALRTGGVDMMHTTNGQVIKELRDDPAAYPFIEITNKGETTYSLLHVTQPDSPLNDRRVRCALAWSEDRDVVNQTISQGVPELANGPFSPTQIGYLDDTGYPATRDMAKAQELIAEYKAENPGPISIALATTNDQTNLTIANFQKQWYEEAGIDTVTIDQIDQANYIVTALIGNFQVFQWRNHGGFDLDNQYHWWHSSSAGPIGGLELNFGRIRDENLDALLDENRASDDPARKKEIAEEVNRLFATECYNLYGSWTVWAVASRPGIEGKAGELMVLPDGVNSVPGSGIAGTIYTQTLWIDS